MDKAILYTLKENDPIYDELLTQKISNLFRFQEYRYIGLEVTDDEHKVLFFLYENEIDKLDKIFTECDVYFDKSDVSKEILIGDFVLNSKIDFITYKTVMSKFIRMNSSVDSILDKISKYGISSLSESDKFILKTH